MAEIIGSIISVDKLSGKDALVAAVCCAGIYGIVELVKSSVEMILTDNNNL